MIVRIVPVKRTPRAVSVFDYLVPSSLESKVRKGQLAVIELRKTKEFGVIVEILHEHNPEFAYKELDALVHDIPLVPETTQQFLQLLSSIYATSLATVYKTALLPLQKRKLKTITLNPLPENTTETGFSESYELYTTATEHERIISSSDISGTTLILVPEISLLESTKKIIERAYTGTIVVWHSDLSDKEKFTQWLTVRNATDSPLVVIGTRSALTLPFTNIKKIILDREQDGQYKSYDQQPKFHARDMACELARINGSRITYTSFSPSFGMYYHIAKKNVPCMVDNQPYTSGLLFNPSTIESSISLIEHIPQPGDKRICSITTEEHIVHVAKENRRDIVILVQRKGFATLIVCKDCGHIETSRETGLPMVFYRERNIMEAAYTHEERPLPRVCTACGSTLVLLQGIGDEKVAEHITRLFVHAGIKMPVIIVDDETPSSTLKELETLGHPRVIVGTIKALSHIRERQTGLFVMLDLDRYLAVPEYHALENTIHIINEVRYRKNPDTPFIIESTRIDKPLFKLFSEPDRLYRTELGIRQKLNLPPYTTLTKYTIAGSTKAASKKNTQIFQEIMARRLTEFNISAKMSPIFETHPTYYQRQYWHGMIITMKNKSYRVHAENLHTRLPLGVVVDYNPTNTLSP